MKNKKDFREWQQDEISSKIEKETAAKNKAEEERVNRYEVIVEGKTVHETGNFNEAKRTADSVHGQVLWLLDGDGIRYVYPQDICKEP
jgi:hypothetical protein